MTFKQTWHHGSIRKSFHTDHALWQIFSSVWDSDLFFSGSYFALPEKNYCVPPENASRTTTGTCTTGWEPLL